MRSGNWQIQPAELRRVYPPKSEDQGSDRTSNGSGPDQSTAILEERLTSRDAMPSELQLDDVKTDRDRWRAQAEASTRLLSDQRRREPWWRLVRSASQAR
jgi:hypothetical protein